MADQKNKLAMYYERAINETHFWIPAPLWPKGKHYSIDRSAVDKYFEYSRRHTDENGEAILDPEALSEGSEILNNFLQDTVHYAATNGEQLAKSLPIFIKFLYVYFEDIEELTTNAQRLLQEVILRKQKAVNVLTAMTLVTTEILLVAEGRIENSDPLPPRVERLIKVAAEMYADWLASEPFDSSPPPQERKAENFSFHTGQEWYALTSAASDGRIGKHYSNDIQAGSRTHSIEGFSHYLVKLQLTQQEVAAGIGMDALERLTVAQDADCSFALLYVSSVLIPEVSDRGGYAGGWISLDDVMGKIGWEPRSTKEREEYRGRIWQYIVFGARAHVIGRRSVPYRDPEGNEIPTQIETPLWSIMSKEIPVQQNLFPDQEVPVKVEIVISKQWEYLMTNPKTAQYLPMFQLLAEIPGSQPGGAWARTIGMSLYGFWRRLPRETMACSRRPTRKELLTRFLPKKAAPDEVLKSHHPARAVEYWHSALQELVARGVLARSGEAGRTLDEMKAALPRYNWQEAWLKEYAELAPGPKIEEYVKRCAENLPIIKPKVLDKPRRQRRQANK